MIRKIGTLLIAATLPLAAAPAKPAPENSTARELRELRGAVEALTQQVAKLSQLIEGKPASATAEPAPAPVAEPPAAAEPAAKTEFAIPKAEAVATAPHHVVVKGETLTSIAKAYNVPLNDLLKANKSVNPAKLQIGQSLTIPTATAPEKKETP